MASQATAQDDNRPVAATVDGQPIYVETIDRAAEQLVGEQAITEEAREHLRGELLELFVQRRLAAAWLAANGFAASDDDIALALARLERALGEQEQTLEDYLESSGLSEAELHERLAWEIGWGRFLERQLTDENLANYFERYHRDFDGTELRVAQVLLQPAAAPGEEGYEAALAETMAQASELRERIATGELTFAEAAEEFSAAPSASEGGSQGWIRRHEPMPEAFSAAAFELEAGEMSQPVASRFGVHLILCEEVKPGERTWQECREQLVPACERYVLERIADRRRPASVVEYTGEVAYGGGSN